ncbi:LOW QUALITY PROTEIN: hypothetical protein V1477_004115 [Vespula maculifrons]|uniref:Uncharacterized protein n=1 Tax=Vespula maculifrons TaxID=7453 RepID=A0ABD2CTB0_VESMC
MSEADGVDGGAICKRGFTHLQFAEKSEAPEAERHLGSVESPLARGSPMQQPPRGVTWVGSTCYISKSYKVQVFPSEWLHISKSFPFNSKLKFAHFTFFLTSSVYSAITTQSDVSSVHTLSLNANTGRIGRTLTPVSAGTDVVFSGANKSPTLAGPKMQQPPSGGTWVGSTCDIFKSLLGDRGTNHRGIFTRKEGMSPCFRTRMIGKTLTRVTAGTRVGVREREIKSCRGLRFDFQIEI